MELILSIGCDGLQARCISAPNHGYPWTSFAAFFSCIDCQGIEQP
jgi:hypothetical protein